MIHKKIKVVLASNPNSGKTTAFNANHRCTGLERKNTVGSFYGKAILCAHGRLYQAQLAPRIGEYHEGKYLHHDGGRMNSQEHLPELHSNADMVCFPMGCVSHNATMRLRWECRCWQQANHPSHNSGLSFFAKALRDLAAYETFNTKKKLETC